MFAAPAMVWSNYSFRYLHKRGGATPRTALSRWERDGLQLTVRPHPYLLSRSSNKLRRTRPPNCVVVPHGRIQGLTKLGAVVVEPDLTVSNNGGGGGAMCRGIDTRVSHQQQNIKILPRPVSITLSELARRTRTLQKRGGETRQEPQH